MNELLSITDASRALRVTPARVRAMVAHGQLPATKIGGRWIVEQAAIEQRLRVGAGSGRPFSPRGAWALLLLASGEPAETISSRKRSRLRRALALEGFQNIAARLPRRADVCVFSAHPGEIQYAFNDPRLVRSGISAAAAHGFDLASGVEVDGYLCAEQLDDFVQKHALSPAGSSGNARIRVVRSEAWSLIEGRVVAPLAAVALDLAQSADSRLARAGRSALKEIDTQRAARAKS